MYKLLVNAPSGLQEIIDVTETGSYFDPALVIWDERIDGTLPEVTLGGMVRIEGSSATEESEAVPPCLSYDAELAASRVTETPDQIIYRLTMAVQRHLDSTALSHGYDHIISLCSYRGSNVAEWDAEGIAGMAWRDAVWSACKTIMEAVIAQERAVPTEEQFIAELPVMEWPV